MFLEWAADDLSKKTISIDMLADDIWESYEYFYQNYSWMKNLMLSNDIVESQLCEECSVLVLVGSGSVEIDPAESVAQIIIEDSALFFRTNLFQLVRGSKTPEFPTTWMKQ